MGSYLNNLDSSDVNTALNGSTCPGSKQHAISWTSAATWKLMQPYSMVSKSIYFNEAKSFCVSIVSELIASCYLFDARQSCLPSIAYLLSVISSPQSKCNNTSKRMLWKTTEGLKQYVSNCHSVSSSLASCQKDLSLNLQRTDFFSCRCFSRPGFFNFHNLEEFPWTISSGFWSFFAFSFFPGKQKVGRIFNWSKVDSINRIAVVAV